LNNRFDLRHCHPFPDMIVRTEFITPMILDPNNSIITIVAAPPFAEIETIYVPDWKRLCAQLVPASRSVTRGSRRPIDAGGLSAVGWKLRGARAYHSRS
jgi:hypothetical protein